MPYRYSQLDIDNRNWFNNNNAVGTLSSIRLLNGKIRGLFPFELNFRYPISAISGINGSGKSTILAVAACAFHNRPTGYCPPLRNKPYYTFSDFFVQSSTDIPVEGVEIRYGIRHNNWYRNDPGLRFQRRLKRRGGRWNNYDTRVPRNVVYFGVQRVVPHFERSVQRSYRNRFSPSNMQDGIRAEILQIVNKIFGKNYDFFDNYTHSKYLLPQVSVDGMWYSGFNMGSGEIAVFDIVSSLYYAGRGTLIIIDEVELGLHEGAQRQFIEELKMLCSKFFCQIIFSTHSHMVLSSLPPEARFFVERVGNRTVILNTISADYACGKMGRRDSQELDIFVEDEVAKSTIELMLSAETRRRVSVMSIGSSNAVLRQMTARYLEGASGCVCVLDGNQRRKRSSMDRLMAKYAELSTDDQKTKLSNWLSDRVLFLPGSEWPEKWIVGSIVGRAVEAVEERDPEALSQMERLVQTFRLRSIDELREFLVEAEGAGKHNEIVRMSELICANMTTTRDALARVAIEVDSENVGSLVSGIEARLVV